jgi:hypothetical protein
LITKKIYGIAECDSAIYELTKELTVKYSQDEYCKYRVYSPYEGAPVASYFKGDNAENTWNRAQICKVNPESLTADIVNKNFLSKSIIFIKTEYLGELKKINGLGFCQKVTILH